MRFLSLILLTGLLIFQQAAHAQGCPAGTYPWSGNGIFTCLPDSSYNQQSIQNTPLSSPQGKWETRWGAIATDDVLGTLGVTSDQPSQSRAEKSAVKDCLAKGGKQCTVNVAYGNSCAAMVVGDNGYSVRTGPTKENAIGNATKGCSANYQSCHTYYVNCVQPALIK